jgi:hypothetical protein
MQPDPELQKYYEDLLSLFITEGWNAFVDDIKEAKEAITIESLSTSEQLHHAKGVLEVYNRIIAYEDIIRNAMDDLDDQGA